MNGFFIDAKYLLCPLPVLRADKKLQTLLIGDQLTITGTSEDGIAEFELYQKDHPEIEIVSSAVNGAVWTITLKRIS